MQRSPFWSQGGTHKHRRQLIQEGGCLALNRAVEAPPAKKRTYSKLWAAMSMKAVRTKCAHDMPSPVRCWRRALMLLPQRRRIQHLGGIQVYGEADETGDYLADVKRKLKFSIIKNTPEELLFDMVGIDAPIANALRRIMIADVRLKPAMPNNHLLDVLPLLFVLFPLCV